MNTERTCIACRGYSLERRHCHVCNGAGFTEQRELTEGEREAIERTLEDSTKLVSSGKLVTS